MKTALSMAALAVLLTSGCESSSVAEQVKVTTSAEPTTRLYVRTIPEGADVYLDGKQRGKAPELFEVPPGVKSMMVEVELNGQGNRRQEVAVEGGRITRVEFRFAEGPEASHGGSPSFGPVVEQVLKDPEKGVAEALDLDTGRRATMEGFGENDRQTHAWIRQQKVDVMGFIERELPGVFLLDCAVYDNPVSWDKITPQEIVDHRALNQNEPNPIIPLAAQDPAKLPLTCLFETREGTQGVLQLVGLSDDKQGVKIRYKLVEQKGRKASDVGREEPPDPGKQQPLSFGRVVEQVLRNPEKHVAELLDLDTGRRATFDQFGVDHRQTESWARSEAVDVSGCVAGGQQVGVLFFHCAVYENPFISWDEITPQEVVGHRRLNQSERKPVRAWGMQEPSMLPLTCLFETCQGSKGVLQLVGLSDDKQGVKIRYKLVEQKGREASDAGPEAPPDRGKKQPLSFGPVVEQVLRDPEKHVAELLDLDTGRRVTNVQFDAQADETQKWARAQAVDVCAYVADDQVGVLFFSCKLCAHVPISWDEISPQEVADHRELYLANWRPMSRLSFRQEASKLPLTCLFATRQGSRGVLQILGLSEDKQGVKIRYKLLPREFSVSPAAQAIRQVLEKFAKAAFEGDKETMAKLIHDKSHHLLAQMDDMREIVDAGMNPVAIVTMAITDARAVAATELIQLDHRQYPQPVCMVYILEKQGGTWVVRDVDVEDEQGLADEIHRFNVGTSPRGEAREGELPAVASRAKQLKANIDSFTLTLARYSGEQPPGPPQQSLVLHVPTNGFKHTRAVQIGKRQAEQIIDHLAVEGFLNSFHNMHEWKFNEAPGAPTTCSPSRPEMPTSLSISVGTEVCSAVFRS